MTTPTVYQKWSERSLASVINDADEGLIVQGGSSLRFTFTILKAYLDGRYVVGGANVGSGAARVFRDKTGTSLNFRTLASTTYVSATEVGNNINLALTSAATDVLPTSDEKAAMTAANAPAAGNPFATISDLSGGGEANLGASVGTGAEVFRDKTGVTLNFRDILGDANISAAVNGNNVDLSLTSAVTGVLPTSDEKDAMTAANAPATGNPFATIADVGSGGGIGAGTTYVADRLLVSESDTGGSETAQTPLALADGELLSRQAGNWVAVPQGIAGRLLVYQGGTAAPAPGLTQASSYGINTVGNTILTDVATGTIKGRFSAGTGDPEDFTITSLQNETSPAGNVALFAQLPTGEFAQVEVGNLPTGGGGEANLGASVGTGAEVFRDKTGVTLNFRDILGDANISAAVNANNVELSLTTAVTDVLPTSDEKDAMTAANAPATGNPFATAADLTGGDVVHDANSTDNAVQLGSSTGDKNIKNAAGLTFDGSSLTLADSDVLWQASGNEVGAAGPLAAENGVFLARLAPGGSYNSEDGGIAALPGILELHGQKVILFDQKHTTDGGRQAYIGEDGTLFGVDPPPPGWSDTDTDTALYARSGVGLNVWQNITGLVTTVAEDVASGEPFDVGASVFTRNTTTNRTGVVEIGFGVNGAQPTTGLQSYTIVESFEGYVTLSLRLATVTLTATDTISVWMRVTSQSNSQFSTGLQFDGGAGNAHEMYIGVPAQGGGGGAGDVVHDSTTVDNAIQLGSSTTGKSIKNASNLLWDGSSLTASPATGEVRALMSSGDDAVRVQMLPGNGTLDARRFEVISTLGVYTIVGANDDGTGTRNLFVITHAGDANLEQGEYLEQNIPVQYPTPVVVAGPSFDPDFTAGNSPLVQITGNCTITGSASGAGSKAVNVDAGVTVTLDGSIDVRGPTPAAGKAYIAYLDRNAAGSMSWTYGGAQP